MNISAPRSGVSELYAAMLLVGVTLSLGALVVSAATSQMGLASGAALLGGRVDQESLSTQLAFVFSTATGGTCGLYHGAQEGTSLTVGIYDYGSGPFAPLEFAVNSTLVGGAFAPLGPGELGLYSIPVGGCVHASGQTVVAIDATGDGIQFET